MIPHDYRIGTFPFPINVGCCCFNDARVWHRHRRKSWNGIHFRLRRNSSPTYGGGFLAFPGRSEAHRLIHGLETLPLKFYCIITWNYNSAVGLSDDNPKRPSDGREKLDVSWKSKRMTGVFHPRLTDIKQGGRVVCGLGFWVCSCKFIWFPDICI